MAVPNIFGTATAAIPLSQLDQNFATAITLGNTAVYLGNTTTSLGNVTLTNVTISSGNVTVTGANISGTANVSTLVVTGNQTSLGNVSITGNVSANIATFGAGTAALPAITTTGDTNTGIFFPAADTIAFTEGGAEAMRIDSSGNVGIGTASPGARLDVRTTSSTQATFTRTGQTAVCTLYLSQADTYLSATNSGANLILATQDTERMRIDSSGKVFIGTTSFTGLLNMTQTAADWDIVENSTNAGIQYFNSFRYNSTQIGTITGNNTATAYNTSSDYRLKNTIAPMTGALAKVALLKPCTYKWNADGSDGQGFIAHELDAVVPGCVTGKKDATSEEEYEVTPAVPAVVDAEGVETTPAVQAVKGTRTVPSYQGIDTSFLVATLTAAIQEQQALITALTARITALENK